MRCLPSDRARRVPALTGKYIGMLAALILATAGIGIDVTFADEVSSQIWLDYNASHQVSPKVDIFGDAGIRWATGSEGLLRLVLRPSMGVPVGRVRLSFAWATSIHSTT